MSVVIGVPGLGGLNTCKEEVVAATDWKAILGRGFSAAAVSTQAGCGAGEGLTVIAILAAKPSHAIFPAFLRDRETGSSQTFNRENFSLSSLTSVTD